MKTAIPKLALMLTLLTANAASAHHELIVTPQPHGSDSRTIPQTQPVPQARPVAQTAPEIRYRGPYLTTYVAGGFGSGGDVMGRFTDNYGDTDRIRSGGGFMFEGGLLAALDTSTMLRLTAGYEIDTTGRTNGESTFDRVRFDLMFLRNFGGHELGVGATAHTGVGYRCDINSICSGDFEFDDALGYTIEYALTSLDNTAFSGSQVESRLHPLRNARLGLRFTDIEYQPLSGVNTTNASTPGEIIDGKSLSLFLGFAF